MKNPQRLCFNKNTVLPQKVNNIFILYLFLQVVLLRTPVRKVYKRNRAVWINSFLDIKTNVKSWQCTATEKPNSTY